MNNVELFPLRSPLVRPGDSLINALSHAVERSRMSIRSGDILAVASKVISTSEGRLVSLSGVNPSLSSIRLARRYHMVPEFVQVVADEADEIFGGVSGTLLTLKDGIATPNAGIDRKNSRGNSVVLWPRNPRKSAILLRESLIGKTKRKLGVTVVDSRVTPMRLGTIGISLASVGFKPVRDFRGEPDLNNRRIGITFQSLGDGVAASAQLLMGESTERVPFVLVRGAPVEMGEPEGPSEKMPAKDCLYMSQISSRVGHVN